MTTERLGVTWTTIAGPPEGRPVVVEEREHGLQNFDRLAKTLAAGATRRRVGRALVGGLAALGVAALGREPAGAATDRACKGKPAISNNRCPENAQGCTNDPRCFCAITVAGDKRCVNLANEQCPEVDECDSGKDCRRGQVCIQVAGCCGRRRNLCVRRCR
ncbi:MAG: hypothetical protein M3464_16575 [Chloroflexota bacterium]|nr:hypothetical protein [Chloroflexota bacterium]